MRDDETTDANIQAVTDVTGLSEKAINNLKRCQEENECYWHGEIANSIIESDDFISIVAHLTKAAIEKDHKIDFDIYKVSTKDIGKTKAVESFYSLIATLENKYKDFLTPYRYDLKMASSVAYSLHKRGKINNDELNYLLGEFKKGNFDLVNMDLDQIHQIMKDRR